MEKFRKLRVDIVRMLHTFNTYVEVKANTPLGQLLMESVSIIFAVYLLKVIADRISTLL